MRVRKSGEKNEEDEEIYLVNDQAEIKGSAIESGNGVVYIIDEVLRCPCLEGRNEV